MTKRAPAPVAPPEPEPVRNNFTEAFMKYFGEDARALLARGKPAADQAPEPGAPRRWRGPRKPAAPDV